MRSGSNGKSPVGHSKFQSSRNSRTAQQVRFKYAHEVLSALQLLWWGTSLRAVQFCGDTVQNIVTVVRRLVLQKQIYRLFHDSNQ